MELTNILAFIGSLGGAEVFLILLLFGAKRIPELAKGLGRGIREFKEATNEIKCEIKKPGKMKRRQRGGYLPQRMKYRKRLQCKDASCQAIGMIYT